MKPIIGVMPLWEEEKERIWMSPSYMDSVEQAGGIPIIFPFSTDEGALKKLAGMCGGFLFTGGPDVSPERYQEAPLEGLVSCCEKRDQVEFIVLREAIKTGKPLLGICRGLQLINVGLGGTLYQDIPTQRPSELEHRQEATASGPSHDVTLIEGTPLREKLGLERLPVNSFHHQAVKALAPGLEVMAVSPDGLVEAFHLPGHRFLWAVQWHPERSCQTDSSSRRIFSALIEAVG